MPFELLEAFGSFWELLVTFENFREQIFQMKLDVNTVLEFARKRSPLLKEGSEFGFDFARLGEKRG